MKVWGFLFFVQTHHLCACLRGNAQEGEVKRKMTQKGKGVRAQQGGQKVEQGVREMVVLRGCAGCTMTVLSCNV